MSREPHAIYLQKPKPPDTIRIFVFGESAAFGDPLPAFGLPRMIEAMLELRHPAWKFEVVNAGMTAINSYAIRSIARDCRNAEGEVWVLYIGNNEVVGPFGAGTVFGSQTLPLPVIRSSLALKRTRVGQAIDSLLDRKEGDEWGGMVMFIKQQVAMTDPRMAGVRRNFESNLQDIVRTGRRTGAGIVLCTVAVNLKDCPPFDSKHRADLTGADRQQWENLWARGLSARQENNVSNAVDAFHRAAALDDQYADLRFQLAELEFASGQPERAKFDFEAARDLDTLRFRCDSQLNRAIRNTAANVATGGVELADVEGAFAGTPAGENFYDHVHLTFDGNYAAAREIVPHIEALLGQLKNESLLTGDAWPTKFDCAKRLGWSEAAERAAWIEMLPRLTDPPFVNQFGHQAQIERLQRKVQALSSSMTAQSLAASLQMCERSAAQHGDDPDLQMQVAVLADVSGHTNLAVKASERAAELLPTSIEAWGRLASVSEKNHDLDRAAEACRRVISINPDAYYAYNNLGRMLTSRGDNRAAINAYRKALRIKPRFGPAWLSLGELIEKTGEKSEANRCFQQALRNRVRSPSELLRLANFCRDRGWFLAAATNLAEAITLSPADPAALLRAGQDFSAAGVRDDAKKYFAEAIRISPQSGPAHFLLGRELGLEGNSKAAEEHFREAAQLMPDVAEARINLAVTLANQGRTPEAIAEYESILNQWPTNQMAQRNLELLRRKAPTP